MLTVEMLRGNAALAGLTDEQLNSIAVMSQNDENTVIGNRIGALHGQYDTDILSISGITKNEGEKSYDYMKRVMAGYKSAAASTDTLKTEITGLKAEKEKLQKQLESGSADATLKQALKDTEARLSQAQAKYETSKTELENTKKSYEAKIKDIQVDYAFDKAIAGMTFKADVDDSVKAVLLKDAKQQVLTKGTPDFVEINGVRTLVFRDANGLTLNNPTNLAPLTISEMLSNVDSLKSILGTGTAGAGTRTVPPTPTADPVLQMSQARSQVEADNIIEKYLMDKGYTRYSKEFITESTKLRAQYNVDKLPIR